jgi:hypothetical protein
VLNKLAWVISGLALPVFCFFAFMMTIFASDSPSVASSAGFHWLGWALLIVPLSWIVGLILWISEARNAKRKARLWLYTLAPYLGVAVHLAIWTGVLAGKK